MARIPLDDRRYTPSTTAPRTRALCLIGLAVSVIVVIAGAIGADMDRDVRLSALREEIGLVRDAVDRIDPRRKVFDQTSLASSGSIPGRMLDGGSIRHSFGGTITLGGDDRFYWITLHDVPTWTCRDLVRDGLAPTGYQLTGVSFPDGNQGVYPGSVPAHGGGLCEPQGHATMDISWQFLSRTLRQAILARPSIVR